MKKNITLTVFTLLTFILLTIQILNSYGEEIPAVSTNPNSSMSVPVTSATNGSTEKKEVKPLPNGVERGYYGLTSGMSFDELNGILKKISPEFTGIELTKLELYSYSIKESVKEPVKTEKYVVEGTKVVCNSVYNLWIKNDENIYLDYPTNTAFFPLNKLDPYLSQLFIEVYNNKIFRITYYPFIQLKDIHPIIDSLKEKLGEATYKSELQAYFWYFTDFQVEVMTGFNYLFPKTIEIKFTDLNIQKEYYDFLRVISKELETSSKRK